MTTTDIELAKLAVQAVGLLGTLVAAVVAVGTLRRNEKWKRAEFLAAKMKDFFDDRRVQQALTLIDWGSRWVALLDESGPDKGVVRVTRQLQGRALMPHTLVNEGAASDVESTDGCDVPMRRYTSEEAAIRDRYDTFLDGLERISGYIESKLIEAKDLQPYLGYWVDDIHAPTKDVEDAEWCALLLTYIHFYRYFGVQRLFASLGRDIAPETRTYVEFLGQMRDQVLAGKLARAVGASYPRSATN